jgi:hypothetical protein
MPIDNLLLSVALTGPLASANTVLKTVKKINNNPNGNFIW